MHRSETIGALAEALAKFQVGCPPIAKTRTATIPGRDSKSGYTYKYADLADTIETTRPGLAENGLSVVQSLSSDGQYVTCSTTVMHKSGEWIESGHYMLPAGDTPQKAGSAATYCRRYSYSAAIGVASEEDDDAAAATHSSGAGSARPALATEKQIGAVWGKAKALGMSADMLCAAVKRDTGKSHPDDLTSAEASAMLDKMQQAIEAEEQ